MERQRRLTHRALPLVVVALAAFITGAVVGAQDPPREAVERFLAAWQKQDFGAMYAELGDAATAEYSAEEFTGIYRDAQLEATVASIRPGEARSSSAAGHDIVSASLTMGTRAFGEISGDLELPIVAGDTIDWRPHLTFPGLRSGERLDGRFRLPERGAILARDGSPLAEGPVAERSSPLGAAGSEIAGETGTPDTERKAEMEASGFPEGTPAGISGLEKALDKYLAGQPGGELVAVDEGSAATSEARTLAQSDPRPGTVVKTTIDPELQSVAFNTLAGRFGGIAAVDARSGGVRALAGIALRAPQPPGSTFKIITTVAALEAEAVKLSDQFEVVQSADVDGRPIDNAHEEFCGGSFVESFARSCNSVFAPLGARLGPEPLLDAAERFGFNSPPALLNAEAQTILLPAVSTIPEIDPGLDAGVSAIGQGKVLATPIQMASVAQTIAAGGVRHPTTLVTDPELGPDAEPERVTTREIARTVRDLMVSAVSTGTGQAAIIPGVEVAGKTGTAELGELVPLSPEEQAARQMAIDEAQARGDQEAVDRLSEREKEVNAWFAAFAPAKRPKIAVAVMFIKAEGDGGTVAAPVAREVIAAALQS